MGKISRHCPKRIDTFLLPFISFHRTVLHSCARSPSAVSTVGTDAATPVFLKPTTSSTALTCYFDSSLNFFCFALGGYNTFCEYTNKYLYIARNSCPTGYTNVTLKGF